MTGLVAPMTGDAVRGEPLAEGHRAALNGACAQDPDIWAIYATNFGPDGFDAGFDKIMALPWARFALLEGDTLVGMSCFLGIDEERGLLEIGNTYYRPAWRGTGFNRRAKDMMLRRAFDAGYRRVEFRVDARNARSQAAMTKLGAIREGVMRADRITWNGHVRDTVLFSILKEEWQPAGGSASLAAS
ncbi:MAG: GNAT family protein [Sphingomicrobium sp.]